MKHNHTLGQIVVLVSLVGLALCLSACGGPARAQNDDTPTLAPTQTLSPTIVPTQTPTPTPTINAAIATSDALYKVQVKVGNDVAAQGYEMFSDEWNERVSATLTAMGLGQPTATPAPEETEVLFPFPVVTEEMELNWGTKVVYTFAHPEDLQVARQAFTDYFDFISFRNGPPAENVADELKNYWDEAASAGGAQSCLYSDITSGIRRLYHAGYYLRLTPQGQGLTFGEYWLDSFSQVELEQRWQANVTAEKVEISTGQVVKQKTFSALGGYLSARYDPLSERWIMFDDNGNIYCRGLFFFE